MFGGAASEFAPLFSFRFHLGYADLMQKRFNLDCGGRATAPTPLWLIFWRALLWDCATKHSQAKAVSALSLRHRSPYSVLFQGCFD